MRSTIALIATSAILLVAYAGTSMTAQQPAATTPTFTRDVAPVLYKLCISCHRRGEIAPMSLVTYEEARPWAKAILKVVSNGTMPPWHAEAPAGTFHNERILSDAERKILMQCATEGAPKGEEKDLPAVPAFTECWFQRARSGSVASATTARPT